MLFRSRDKVGKKGIVRDKNTHFHVIKDVADFCKEIGLGIVGLTFSPITGATGNIEFLIYLNNRNINNIDEKSIIQVIDEAHNSFC